MIPFRWSRRQNKKQKDLRCSFHKHVEKFVEKKSFIRLKHLLGGTLTSLHNCGAIFSMRFGWAVAQRPLLEVWTNHCFCEASKAGTLPASTTS